MPRLFIQRSWRSLFEHTTFEKLRDTAVLKSGWTEVVEYYGTTTGSMGLRERLTASLLDISIRQ